MYVLSYEKSYDEMKIETYCTSAGCMQWSGELCMQGPMSAALQCSVARGGVADAEMQSLACSREMLQMSRHRAHCSAACRLLQSELQAAVPRDQYC